jgi:energy-coupling factor transporter ATP-binding protein EcfA2
MQEGQIIEINETLTLDNNTKESAMFAGNEFIDSDKGYMFFYRDNIIKLSINEEVEINSNKKESCTISFYYPLDKECADKDFLKFISNTVGPKVFILNHEFGEYNFTKFTITLPKTFDLSLNYGSDFEKIDKKIVKSLNENHSGLYMLHGPPGTGKSTYIKYLSSVLKKDVIFFPTGLVGSITSPEIISLLIRKQNCVLILEDAEKALVKRETGSDSSLVSTLLNMTDGILGDVLKLNVIVTYNCDRADIDEALLRRGRLKAEHSFQPLSKENVKKLVDKLKLKIDVEEDMTLADIYNYKKDEELIGNREAINDRPRIGFNA